METPVCADEITAREVNKEIQPFLKLLMLKVEELNFRVREITQQILIALYKNNDRAD